VKADNIKDNTLRHLVPSVIFTLITVVALGLVYPLVMTLVAQLIFPNQANGSIIYQNGKPIGSDIIGQLWTKPQYFQGRPSAAGNGYDPTSTGATNLGPTSKKLIDATRATIVALKKANPDATGPIPMDLVTSSASGIDPDISPEAAYYQAPRVAKARHMTLDAVDAIVAAHVQQRELGVLGDPRVNVLALNLALDAAK
jgi:K+-transporting ATPase ATPase C chain